MNGRENHTDDTDIFFRKNLENLEVMPDPSVWFLIEKRLREKRRKSLLIITRRLAAGITLLTLLGIAIHLTQRDRNEFTPSLTNIRNQPSAEQQNGPADTDGQPLPSLLPGLAGGATDGKGAAGKAGPGTGDGPSAGNRKPGSTIMSVPSESGTLAVIASGQPAGTSGRPHMDDSLWPGAANTEESRTGNPADAGETIQPPDRADNSVILTQGGQETEKEPETIAEMPGISADDPEAVKSSLSETKSRWSIGGEFAPVYSYRNLRSDYYDRDMIEKFDEAESGLLAYGGGIRVSYSSSRRLTVCSGLYYSRYGQQKELIYVATAHDDEYLVFDQSGSDSKAEGSYIGIINSTGTISQGETAYAGDMAMTALSNNIAGKRIESTYSATQCLDYLELPLTLHYRLLDRRVQLNLAGGIAAGMLVGNKVLLNREGESTKIGKTGQIRHISYSGLVGIGLSYKLLSSVDFFLEPRFRYNLNAIDKTAQINVHPYSFGLFTGLSYHF